MRLRGVIAACGALAVAAMMAGCAVTGTSASVQGAPADPGQHRPQANPTAIQTVQAQPPSGPSTGSEPTAQPAGSGGTLRYSGAVSGSDTFSSADCSVVSGQLQYLNAPGTASGKPLALAVLRSGEGLTVEFTPAGASTSYRADVSSGASGLSVSQSRSLWRVQLTGVAALPAGGGAGLTLQGAVTCTAS